MTPTTPATFYAFDDSLVSIPLLSLTAWISAVKMAIRLGNEGPWTRTIRKRLKTPEGYSLEDILDHLVTVREETHAHYGL